MTLPTHFILLSKLAGDRQQSAVADLCAYSHALGYPLTKNHAHQALTRMEAEGLVARHTSRRVPELAGQLPLTVRWSITDEGRAAVEKFIDVVAGAMSFATGVGVLEAVPRQGDGGL